VTSHGLDSEDKSAHSKAGFARVWKSFEGPVLGPWISDSADRPTDPPIHPPAQGQGPVDDSGRERITSGGESLFRAEEVLDYRKNLHHTDRQMHPLRVTKRLLLKSGLRPSPRIEFLNALLALGRWLKQHPSPVHLVSREALYDHVSRLFGGEAIDYIEAGVFRGDSIRCWATLSSHPGSRFFGFDTFTGLPEAWETALRTFKPGSFSAGGEAPQLGDGRVRFVKGRFQDTMPGFLRTYRPQRNRVIHCDADLYASTLYVLTILHPVLDGGTILIFDNFSVAHHDFRAFRDYVQAYGRAYEVVATAEIDREKIAIRLA